MCLCEKPNSHNQKKTQKKQPNLILVRHNPKQTKKEKAQCPIRNAHFCNNRIESTHTHSRTHRRRE